MPSNMEYTYTYRRDPEDTSLLRGLSFPDSQPRWKKIALAVFLCVLGSALLFAGVGVFVNDKQHAGAIPLIVLGCITFLPGAYYTRIAWLSWRGYEGYTLSSIPELE